MCNGVLSCLVCAKHTDDEGNELYHWNTDLFQKLTVGKGMECSSIVADMAPDVITQLLVKMKNVDNRTSEEAMKGYISEYMEENPPKPTEEQITDVLYDNPDIVQNSVDNYLDHNPLQLDETLTDSTKAAPANLVGKLSGEIVDLKDYLENITLSNETKAINMTSLFTANGYLNKQGVFISRTNSLCTDFIKAKQGDVFYLYVSQDDDNTLPIAIYDMNKIFIKGIENKGFNYTLSYLEYEVEEDCLIRISTMTGENSLIYKKQSKNNADVFETIKANLGELETYYEDIKQFVLGSGEDNKRIDGTGTIYNYDGGFISDYIKVEEGDTIKAGSYVLYKNPVLILYYGTKKLEKYME